MSRKTRRQTVLKRPVVRREVRIQLERRTTERVLTRPLGRREVKIKWENETTDRVLT